MITFKDFVVEINASGEGGVFGGGDSFSHGGNVGNTDFYAAGDSRVPYFLGLHRRINKTKKSKSRKRKGKRKS